MKVIRIKARLFMHIVSLIKEEEANGHKYISDSDDGTVIEGGQNQMCVKVVRFNDGTPLVTYEDRTHLPDLPPLKP